LSKKLGYFIFVDRWEPCYKAYTSNHSRFFSGTFMGYSPIWSDSRGKRPVKWKPSEWVV